MKIRLRPYHPTLVVAFYGMGEGEAGYNKKGFDKVLEKIRKFPNDIQVEIVEEFDDICLECERRRPDSKGSIWGKTHTCDSALDPAVVDEVNLINGIVLKRLGISIGTVLSLKELVILLKERIPEFLEKQGREKYQKNYSKGLEEISGLMS